MTGPRPGDTERLLLDRRSGALTRWAEDGAEQLGNVEPSARRALLQLLPFAPAVVRLELQHAFPPVLWACGTGGRYELPEAVAGPVLALVAYAPLRAAQAAREAALLDGALDVLLDGAR